MKKRNIWFIIASSLILLGLVMFTITMSLNKWDFKFLSTTKYETKTVEINDSFINIYINTDTAYVIFVPSTDKICKIVYNEEEKLGYDIKVIDNTLNINLVNKKEWYDYIGIYFEKSVIKIHLPEHIYKSLIIKANTSDITLPKDFVFEKIDISVSTGDIKCFSSCESDLKIKTSTGDITLSNISCEFLDLTVSTGEIDIINISTLENIDITVSTGDVELKNVTCKNLSSTGNTGDISLEDVIVEEDISIKRSTGDVQFDLCDAGSIYVKTSTGDITGTLLSEKNFITSSNASKPNVPNTTTGGKCELSTNTGDINISIK